MSDLKAGKWYMQRGDKVEGPFAAGLVSRHILLGRLEMNHKVSEDGHNWHFVKDVPSLIPEILKSESDDPMQQERLMAARRWADERLADDRRGADSDARGNERRSDERRDDEIDDISLHRSLLGKRTSKKTSDSVFTAELFIFAIVILIGWAGYYAYQNKPEEVVVDCSAVPGFAVNWTNCILLSKDLSSANLENALLRNARLTTSNLESANLRGADMAYVDLSRSNLVGADMNSASLKGANLVSANLQGASLVNADLSFANLTDADLRSTNLSGTILNKAIWIDGSVCAEDAVGRCN